MPLGWAGRVRERTPQEARWKGSREGREWCVRRRWGDGKGQRRDAGRQKDGWKERRQRRPIGGETHHLWMTLQARCLSQQCTSPLTLYIALWTRSGLQWALINRGADILGGNESFISGLWTTMTLCSLHQTQLEYLHFGPKPSGHDFFGYLWEYETHLNTMLIWKRHQFIQNMADRWINR